MVSAADQETGGVASDAVLVDLKAVPLLDVLSVIDDDKPLAHALRAVIEQLRQDSDGVISAFDSFAK